MTTGMSEEEIYEEATKRVKAKRGFWGHFVFYAVVNVICFLIWALGDRGYPWFLWVLGVLLSYCLIICVSSSLAGNRRKEP